MDNQKTSSWTLFQKWQATLVSCPYPGQHQFHFHHLEFWCSGRYHLWPGIQSQHPGWPTAEEESDHMCTGTDIKHDTTLVPILDLSSFNFKLNQCYSQRWLCRSRCFLYTHPSDLLLGHGSFWYRISPEILKIFFGYYTSWFWFWGIKFHFSFSISMHFHFKKNERKLKSIFHFSKGVKAF